MKTIYLLVFLFICYSCASVPRPAKSKLSFWPLHTVDSTLYGADGVRTMDFNQDGKPDLISGGEEYGATRVYLNQGHGVFTSLEFPSPQVEDALAVDIDQDGQMEVLTFSEGTTREITLHVSDDQGRWTSAGIPATQGIQWMYGAVGQVVPGGPVEIICGSKGANAFLGWLMAHEDMSDVREWKMTSIAPVGWIMSIEWLDLNADGRADILVSDRKGENASVKWYQNPGPDHLDQPWPEHIVGLQGKEPMFLDVADLNGDGLQDIIAADIAGGIFYYEKENPEGRFKPDSLLFAYPDWAGRRGKSVSCVDLDLDGQLEIVTSYEEAENAYGLIYSKFNAGRRHWEHFPISDRRGIKYDKILPLDMDQDGDLDLFTTEERENGNGLGVIWYENLAKSESGNRKSEEP